MMRLKPRPFTRSLWILLLILAFVIPTVPSLLNTPLTQVYAQDDPAVYVQQVAERVHIQNLRTRNTTRWVGGNLGPMDGTEIRAEAGSRFTDWRFTDLYDETTEITLNDISRPVVMNIWASWCGPCRFEFPFLTGYALDESSRNYELWFLNANDTPAAAQRFLRSQASGIKVYVDPGDAFISAIGLRVFPTTILMDTDGTILVAHSGIVTRTVMEFFNAVAANPHLGSIDVASIPPPDVNAIIGPVDPATATPIVYGQQVVGVIDDEHWRVDFRFEGHASEEITINMATTDTELDAYLVLIGPHGQRVAENDDSGDGSTNSRISLTLPADGTYVIVATRFLEADGFGGGGFNLQVNSAAQQPGQGGNANTLQVGIPASGRLTYELKQQSYLLDVTAGQQLTFTLTHDTPEEQLSLQARLGSERLIPYTKTENGELIIEVTVVTTGSYSVYVARSQTSRAGPITYTLLVTEAGSTTPTPPTTPVEGSALTYNSTATGTIDNTTFARRYNFDGKAGDIISIDMAGVPETGNLDTYLQLLGPDGSVLAENDDADLATTNSHIAEFTLPADGTYTIVATRFSGETGFSTGEYILTLTGPAETGPSTNPPVVEGNTLTYGSAATGTIDTDELQQTYTFEGAAGDVVSIEMNTDAGNLDPYVTLVGPDGTTLAENDDRDLTTTNAAIVEYTLPVDGIYTIVASRYGGATGTSTGTFILTLTSTGQTSTTNTPPVTIPESSVIAFDTSVTGTITDDAFAQSYVFDANAGDVVTIEMVANPDDGNLDPLLTLFGPDDAYLASNDDMDLTSINSRIEAFQLPVTGPYTIVASRYDGANGISTGSYILTLTLVEAGPPNVPPVSTAGTLTYGTTATGTISGETYEVLFSFAGTADDVVTIEMTATSGDLDPYLALIGPNGRILTANDDIDTSGGNYNSAIVGYVLPETGTYSIVATRFEAQDGTTQGDFELVLSAGTTTTTTTNPPPVTGTALAYGDTATGALDNQTYEIVYTFEGNAGDFVTIELNATSGDLDTFVALIDASGEWLASNDDIDLASGNTNSAIRDFQLPATGTYSVLVTRYDGQNGISSGSFRLTLTQSEGPPPITPPTTTGTTLSYGDTTTGTISNNAFEQAYIFTGNRGDVVTIQMTATRGDLDTLLVLLDPAGAEVATNDDIDLFAGNTNSAITNFTLPTSGTYTIIATRFDGTNGLTTGDYSLTLTSVSVATTPPTTTTTTTSPTGTATLIAYGDVVTGTISRNNLEERYVFTGNAGDIVSVTMRATSGNLDAYVSILNANGKEIAFNDNDLLSSKQDAVILAFKLPADGTYTIVATRYGVYYGHTEGDYELILTVH